MRLVPEHFRRDGKPKKSYASRTEADAAKGGVETVYQCGFCGNWHRATDRQAQAVRQRIKAQNLARNARQGDPIARALTNYPTSGVERLGS